MSNSALHSLSPAAQIALSALLSGKSVSAAAAEAKVHRTTLHGWIRNNPHFTEALETLRAAQAEANLDRLSALTDGSIAVFERILADQAAPLALQMRAAVQVLKLVEQGNARKHPTLTADEYERRTFADIVESVTTRPVSTSLDQDPAEIPESSTPDFSQSAQQTPRNAPCTCGSKLKYKRGCGKNAPSVLCTAAA